MHHARLNSLHNLYEDFFRDIDQDSALRKILPATSVLPSSQTSLSSNSGLGSSSNNTGTKSPFQRSVSLVRFRHTDDEDETTKRHKFQSLYQQLPMEIHHHIFSYLGCDALVRMSSCAKWTNVLIFFYLIAGGRVHETGLTMFDTKSTPALVSSLDEDSPEYFKHKTTKNYFLFQLQLLSDMAKKERKQSISTPKKVRSSASLTPSTSSSSLNTPTPRKSSTPSTHDSSDSHSEFTNYLSKFDFGSKSDDDIFGKMVSELEPPKVQQFIQNFNALDLQHFSAEILSDYQVLSTLKKVLISVGALKSISALYFSFSGNAGFLELENLFPSLVKVQHSASFFSKLMTSSSSTSPSPPTSVNNNTSSESLTPTDEYSSDVYNLMNFEDVLSKLKVLSLNEYVPKKKFELNQILLQTTNLCSLEIRFSPSSVELDPLKPYEHLKKNVTSLSLYNICSNFLHKVDVIQEFTSLKQFNFDEGAILSKPMIQPLMDIGTGEPAGKLSTILKNITHIPSAMEQMVNKMRSSQLERLSFLKRPMTTLDVKENPALTQLLGFMKREGFSKPVVLFPKLKHLVICDSFVFLNQLYTQAPSDWSVIFSGTTSTDMKFILGYPHTLETLTYHFRISVLPTFNIVNILQNHSNSLKSIVLKGSVDLRSIDSLFSSMEFMPALQRLEIFGFCLKQQKILLEALLNCPSLKTVIINNCTVTEDTLNYCEYFKSKIEKRRPILESLVLTKISSPVSFYTNMLFLFRKCISTLRIKECTTDGPLLPNDIREIVTLCNGDDITLVGSSQQLLRCPNMCSLCMEGSYMEITNSIFKTFSFPVLNTIQIGPGMKQLSSATAHSSSEAFSIFLKGSSSVVNNKKPEDQSITTEGTFHVPSLKHISVIQHRGKDSKPISFFNLENLTDVYTHHHQSLCSFSICNGSLTARDWLSIFAVHNERLQHNLTCLQILDHVFSSDDVEDLLQLICTFSNLEKLYLEVEGNQPNNDFFHRLEKCSKLKWVEIYGKGSKDVSFQTLLSFIIQMDSLENVTLTFTPRVTNTNSVSSTEDLRRVYKSRKHCSPPKIQFKQQ